MGGIAVGVFVGIAGWLCMPVARRLERASLMRGTEGESTPSGIGLLEDRRNAAEQDPNVERLDVPALALAVASHLRSGSTMAQSWRAVLVDVPLLPIAASRTRMTLGLAGSLVARCRGRGRSPGVKSICRDASGQIAGGAEIAGVLRGLAVDAANVPVRRSRRVDSRATAEGLRSLAAMARLAEETGAPAAEVLEAMTAALDAHQESDAERRAALAGPEATARLLGWLPVAGLVLGQVMGARPLEVLLDGGLGSAAGVSGVVLMIVGRRWSSRWVAEAGAPS